MGCSSSMPVAPIERRQIMQDQDTCSHAMLDSKVLKAQALLAAKRLPEALTLLDGVIRKSPTIARALLERGNVHAEMQLHDLALQDVTSAINCQPNYLQGVADARARTQSASICMRQAQHSSHSCCGVCSLPAARAAVCSSGPAGPRTRGLPASAEA